MVSSRGQTKALQGESYPRQQHQKNEPLFMCSPQVHDDTQCSRGSWHQHNRPSCLAHPVSWYQRCWRLLVCTSWFCVRTEGQNSDVYLGILDSGSCSVAAAMEQAACSTAVCWQILQKFFIVRFFCHLPHRAAHIRQDSQRPRKLCHGSYLLGAKKTRPQERCGGTRP